MRARGYANSYQAEGASLRFPGGDGSMIARRLTLPIASTLLALALLLALSCTSALARVTHLYLPTLSEKLSEPVPAKGPHGETIVMPGERNLEPSAATVEAGHLWVYEDTPLEKGE